MIARLSPRGGFESNAFSLTTLCSQAFHPQLWRSRRRRALKVAIPILFSAELRGKWPESSATTCANGARLQPPPAIAILHGRARFDTSSSDAWPFTEIASQGCGRLQASTPNDQLPVEVPLLLVRHFHSDCVHEPAGRMESSNS